MSVAAAARTGYCQLAGLLLWEQETPTSPARGSRASSESKDINVSVVAPRVDVGLAAVSMHCQALD